MRNEGPGTAADRAGRGPSFPALLWQSRSQHNVQRCGVGGELVASFYNLSLPQGLQGAGWTTGGMVPSGSVVAVRDSCRPRALEVAFDWTE